MLDTWIEGASDHLRPDPPKPGTKHLVVRSMVHIVMANCTARRGADNAIRGVRACRPAIRIIVHRGKALANPSVRALMLSDSYRRKEV